MNPTQSSLWPQIIPNPRPLQHGAEIDWRTERQSEDSHRKENSIALTVNRLGGRVVGQGILAALAPDSRLLHAAVHTRPIRNGSLDYMANGPTHPKGTAKCESLELQNRLAVDHGKILCDRHTC